MPRVAFRAAADGSIFIRLADGVALFAATIDRYMPFRHCECIWLALCTARLKLLTECNLLWRQALFPVNSGPARSGMTASQKFLVDGLMAGAAIAGGEVSADHKTVMIKLLLPRPGLVAVQATHTFFGVCRHFIFVDD